MWLHAPMGIDWLPLQKERVFAAVSHILNNSDFLKYGVTSWTPNAAESSQKVLYAVQAHQYLHLAAIFSLFGQAAFEKIIPILDKVVIFTLSIVTAEIAIEVNKAKSIFPKSLIGVWSFTVFLSLPYTYRMLLGIWHDVYSLLFILVAFILFSARKRLLGLFTLVIGFFWQYHWSILFGCFYGILRVMKVLNPSSSQWQEMFPPGFRNQKWSNLLVLSCFVSPIISSAQNILLQLNGFKILNSNLLYRVGIDKASNIHHGGWLAALQFLGGNRLNLCLSPISSIESVLNTGLHSNIFKFNCFTSILGMAILSILSILGYYYLIKSSKSTRWLLTPILFSFIASVLILQQSIAAHLHGRSIFFAVILTIGFTNLLLKVPALNSKHPVSTLFTSLIVTAVIINNIRVSYFTGING